MTLEDPEMLSHRRAGDKGITPDAPYIHYSPPRLLDARKWARGGDVERLREAALGGHAHRLLGLAAPGVKARTFLRDLPKLISKCETLHLTATEGSLQDIKNVLQGDPMRKRLAMCRDRAGVGLLHKAVYYDYGDIISYLLQNYPQTVHMRDSEGRTPLHYAAVCSDPQTVSEEIIKAGAERHVLDNRQRQPAYYITRPTALSLPEPPPPTPQQTELVIKPSNIRIWCHDRDLGRLQQVVWKGQGARLRTEVSNQPAVKRFLEAVPHIMGTIKEIHNAATGNDLEKLKILTEDPIPPVVLSGQDVNGLTALHKAAGLGHYEIVEYILDKYPEGTQITDNDGRTPLHWSILAKDKDKIYNLLREQGAKESKLDNKLKTAAFYKNRPTDMDKSMLNVTPEAPRVASPTYPSSWDWELLRTDPTSIPNSITRVRKHTVEKEAIHSSESTEFQNSEEHDNIDIKSPESETAEPLAEDSHEEQENGEQEFDADIEEDHARDDKNVLDTNDIGETHNDDDEAVNNGEATKSPTPEVPNDSENEDDNSNKINSAHSTHETIHSPDNAHNVNNSTPSASPEPTDVHNGNLSKPSSAISRKSGRLSHRNSSAKSRTSDTNESEENNNNGEDDAASDKQEEDQNTGENESGNEDEHADSNDKGGHEDNNTHDEEHIVHEEHQTIQDSNENNDNNDNETDLKEKSNQIEDTDDESQGEEKSNESEVKGPPKVQDIDDDKGDEPDLEAQESKRSESQNSSKDETKSRPSSKISRRKSSTISQSENFLDVENLKKTGSNATGQSPGGESTIEGVINADAEVDSLDADQRISGNTPDEGDLNIDDAEVQMLIDSGNMEQLAGLVLNGEGERLVGHMARNPDLQAFLDNVPSYMNKIKRVHISSRNGNIKELQSALDRRKFAVARDQVSPHGATPLHVAVLFGHTPIVRYLAGRFPETLSAVDFEGRTALHYAAVLNDNDHYYNILLNMGANSKDRDDNGYSPEDYKNNGKHLSHQQLLKNFGADEALEEEMLSDKVANDTVSSRRELSDPEMQSVLWRCFRLLQDHRRPSKIGAPPSASSNQGSPTTFLEIANLTAPVITEGGHNGQVDVPLFRTEEGKYLAMSLGDPLIKGLTEVANLRPKDPIAFLATYLYNFANQNKTRVGTQESAALIKSESQQHSQSLQAAPAAMAGLRNDEQPVTSHTTIGAATSVPPTPGGPEVAFSSENRDEHGQSMLHFAAARSHARGALLQLIREAGVSLSFRDELYRTARDVSIQANMPGNTKELDVWVLEAAARGELDKMMELLVNGYDHIVDISDEDGMPIAEIIEERGYLDIGDLLALMPEFEDTRERLHQAIRQGDEAVVHKIMHAPQNSDPIQNLLSGKSMASAKNSFGRCSLHIAVLGQKEELAEFIAKTFPETLRMGDNLERTALHYAMGVDNVESTSRILIKAGAKRVLKDLKGRQPSYYFMNKSDILRLKEEEEAY